MAIVYRHIRLDKNEPFYIGIGKNSTRSTKKTSRNPYWKNIVSKTEYKIEILFDDLTWEEACEKEKEFIKLYGRKDLRLGTLVNMTDGGDGNNNIIYTEEHRKKLSENLKGNKLSLGRKLSDEHKIKISKSSKGRIRNEEQRKNISEGQKGRTQTEETRKKISLKNKGFNHTEEAKTKIANSKLGKKRKPFTEEHKQKLREAYYNRVNMKNIP